MSASRATRALLRTVLLVLALIGLGIWLLMRRGATVPEPAGQPAAGKVAAPQGNAPAPIEPLTGPPQLAAPVAYEPRNGVLEE